MNLKARSSCEISVCCVEKARLVRRHRGEKVRLDERNGDEKARLVARGDDEKAQCHSITFVSKIPGRLERLEVS